MRCRMEVLFFMFRVVSKDCAMHPHGRLYLVGAWVLVQVVGAFYRCLASPGWIARSIVILFAIGFYKPLCRTS